MGIKWIVLNICGFMIEKSSVDSINNRIFILVKKLKIDKLIIFLISCWELNDDK